MVQDVVQSFRAIRQFAERAVPEEVIRSIVNAGRRAQSSRNTQPWHFVVVRDRDTLRQLSECGQYAGHLAGAAFAVALVAPPGNDFDLGQAAAYTQLAAWEQGVGSCYASMWESDRAKAILAVPAELRFDLAISFGYPAQETGAPLKRGGRRPFDDVVHWEKW